MSAKGDARQSVSATVGPDLRARLEARAEAEDRDLSRVVRRALLVYEAMPMDEAEARVAEARNGAKPKAPEG